MKEMIFLLCMLDPCYYIPDERIMVVPAPPFLYHPNNNPDDRMPQWCPDCNMFIKWVHLAKPI